VCLTLRRYAERQAYDGANFPYAVNWDSDKILGCDCDVGSEGFDCSKRSCPRGDDPLTTGQADEVQLLTCTMASPSSTTYFTLAIDGETTVRVPTNGQANDLKSALEALIGSVQVTRAPVGVDLSLCTSAGALHSVTFIQRHGDVPQLRVNVDVSQTAPGATIEVVDASTSNSSITIDHPAGAVNGQFTASVGSKEWGVCSNRGVCNEAAGVCVCYTGFDSSDGYGGVGNRGDCGYAAAPVTTCPGKIVECSGHGTCSNSPEYTCNCDRGYMGGDCSLRTCPTGYSWFDSPTAADTAHAEGAECSNRGHCDRETGKCVCHSGFTGDACGRTECPKDASGVDCGGHGRCTSMAKLAEAADTNGDPTPFTYGSPGPGPTAVWDSRTMFGCLCDSGFEGFDCSRRTCPTGDDPHTPGQRETQEILCTEGVGATGSFTLTFRGATTTSIAATALPADLQSALEALDTIDAVVVTCTTTTSVCTAGGNTCTVEFASPLGDLPAMTGSNSGLNALTVNANGAGGSLQGTTENAECSNRGICEYSTGTCQCFVQYGSSDGTNQAGDRGDCGYVEPFVPVNKYLNPWEAAEKGWRLRGSTGSSGVGTPGMGAAQSVVDKWLASAAKQFAF
jgi:hypothetical protein